MLSCKGTFYKKLQELQQRTSLSIENILSLLEFCLNSTYFSFQGKYFEQLEAAAMGSPISPIVPNLYMEGFEVETIRSAPYPSYLWKRFVDDTFTIIELSQKNVFLEHINSIDEHIQFTAEDQRSDGAMLFLDIQITPGKDGSLSTSVFRKPTHTDLYLQWDSHHTLTSKYSVIGTLQHRAQTICSNPHLLQKEEQHLKCALKKCNYSTWALNKIKIKDRKQAINKAPTNRTNINNQKKSYIVVPYYSGLRALRILAPSMGYKCTLKEAPPSRTSCCLPKTKIQYRSKVESSRDTNVTGWIVMKNTLKSPQELLEKGSRNI